MQTFCCRKVQVPVAKNIFHPLHFTVPLIFSFFLFETLRSTLPAQHRIAIKGTDIRQSGLFQRRTGVANAAEVKSCKTLFSRPIYNES